MFFTKSRDSILAKLPIQEIQQKTILNNELFEKIDIEIEESVNKLWFESSKIGILNNFVLPSLTHLVLAEASNKNDIIDITIQIKNSDQFKSLKNTIESAKDDFDDIVTLQNGINALLSKMLKKYQTKNRHP